MDLLTRASEEELRDSLHDAIDRMYGMDGHGRYRPVRVDSADRPPVPPCTAHRSQLTGERDTYWLNGGVSVRDIAPEEYAASWL